MKINFDEQTKREASARFADDIEEMAGCVGRFFSEMHDWAAGEGYHQHIAAYEKFRVIYSDEMKNGTMKTYQAWKQSDASFTALLKEMKAVPADRIRTIVSEFEAPLEETLRCAFRNEPEAVEEDTVHLTRTLEENSAILQEMLDSCFDALDQQLADAEYRYDSLAEDNALYACIRALLVSVLSIAAGLYDRFAKAAEELGFHLNDRAGQTAVKASDASSALKNSSEAYISRLDRLIGLIGD